MFEKVQETISETAWDPTGSSSNKDLTATPHSEINQKMEKLYNQFNAQLEELVKIKGDLNFESKKTLLQRLRRNEESASIIKKLYEEFEKDVMLKLWKLGPALADSSDSKNAALFKTIIKQSSRTALLSYQLDAINDIVRKGIDSLPEEDDNIFPAIQKIENRIAHLTKQTANYRMNLTKHLKFTRLTQDEIDPAITADLKSNSSKEYCSLLANLIRNIQALWKKALLEIQLRFFSKLELKAKKSD